MDIGRRAVVQAIAVQARLDGSALSIAHVCRACSEVMGAAAVCASMRTGGVYEPVCAEGALSMFLAELQVTVGEGPGVEAARTDRPVLVRDLSAPVAQARWPLFVPGAAGHGVGAVFAFPLLVGAATMGALEVYWPRAPADAVIADGLLFAHEALVVLASSPDGPGGDAALSPRWPEVHQATGMISVQMSVGMDEAYAQLRAYAYGNDQSLRDVAREVIERTLSFRPGGRAG